MDIKNSIVAILNTENEIVGTGFVAADCLIVTCAHVVDLTKSPRMVRIRFAVDNSERFADIDTSAYSPKDELDVAILRVSQTPKGAWPLRMSASAGCPGHVFFATGYPQMGDFESLSARGEIISLERDKRGDPYLQLRSQEVAPGMSGGPVLDVARNAVVGMVNSGFILRSDKKHRDTAFATPTETIWKVCPELEPSVSILPKKSPLVDGINKLAYDYDQRIQNFLTEYLGTDAHPIPFGGRDEALHMLDTWLTETTPYLLLAAPAGRGKSALLVRWLDRLKAHEDLALAFVPVSIRFGTNMERVFYAALAARLAFLHGDDVPASQETSTAVYRGLVSDYLSKPLANGRTLLVVLDGLDEAADWQVGADFMPGELPAGVRVVVSARFLAGDADSTIWLRRLNWEHNGLASAPSLVPLDQAGVADVLLKIDCPLDELSRQADIVAELYRLSEGDPLLVNFYVNDLWKQKTKVPRLKSEDLKKLKPGYDEYFKKWWVDQKNLWGEKAPLKVKTTKLVFNLFCGAIGALTTDDLIALDTKDELDSFAIEDAIESLGRFVISVTIDKRTAQTGCVITHSKFRDYFWGKLSDKERNQIEKRFLNWGERTFKEFVNGKRNVKEKDEVPFYVVRNYGTHLARAKQPIEKWLPLVHRQHWAQAWFKVEGAYGGYLQDVQRVWQQCCLLDRQAIEAGGKAPYLGQQIRCALVEASLHSLAGNVPAELIPVLVKEGLWTLLQTWVFIRQMSDSSRQFAAITELIPFLSADQLPGALEAARAIQSEWSRADVLRALAQHLPKGALGQVLEAAMAIQDEWSRARVLSELAQRLPEVVGEALDAAMAIQDEEQRATVLSELAQRLPEGALGQVLEAAMAIQDEKQRATVLSELAQRLPEGALGQVLEAARAIQDEEQRATVLSELAQRLPEVALEALEAAMAIQDEWSRVRVLSELAQHLPEGALGQVLEAARAIQDEEQRARVLSALAQRLPEGALGQVLEAARAIQSEGSRAFVLSVLARRLPEVAGEALEALEAARAIQDEGSRARVLSELAQRLPEGALGPVLEAARALQDEELRAFVLSELARRLPEVAGEALEALEAARTILDEGQHATVLSELAQRLPEGALGPVLEAAWTIQDEGQRAYVLSELAQHLPKGALGQVLEAARAIQSEWSRAYVLRALAQRLPEVAEEALEVARAIQDEWSRARVLSELAQRLPEGALGQVLEAAMAIQDEKQRASVLSALARRLPEGALGQVLEVAMAIQDEGQRADVLSELAQRLPEGALGQVLEAAMAIQDEGQRADVLSELAQRLPEVAGQVFEAAMAIQQDEWSRASVLRALAKRLPEGALGQVLEAAMAIQNEGLRTFVLSALAQRLPEGALGQVLEAARAIQDEGSRARVLSVLARRLPEVAGEALEALEAARAIQDEGSRAFVLSELAQRLPEGALGQVLEAAMAIQDEKQRAHVLSELAQRLPEGALGQVLEAARAIQDEEQRARVLSALAQRLPEGALGQVLEAARAIQDEEQRARVLSELAQHLPELAGEALEAARAIQDEGQRADVLSELAQLLANIPRRECYPAIEITLAELALRTRANLFSDISTLLPVFIYLGAGSVEQEILQAVRDVARWWI